MAPWSLNKLKNKKMNMKICVFHEIGSPTSFPFKMSIWINFVPFYGFFSFIRYIFWLSFIKIKYFDYPLSILTCSYKQYFKYLEKLNFKDTFQKKIAISFLSAIVHIWDICQIKIYAILNKISKICLGPPQAEPIFSMLLFVRHWNRP